MTRAALVAHIAYCHEAAGHCATLPTRAAYWLRNAEQAEAELAGMDVGAHVAGWAECFGAQISEVSS